MKSATAADIEAIVRQQACGFAELVGTLHALHFTGAITLHFLNGQAQTAELGRPILIPFPEHPANKKSATRQISVDSAPGSPPSSLP